MTFDDFMDTYVMTIPTMAIIAAIGFIMLCCTAYLNVARPVGITLDDIGDPVAEEKAQERLLVRKFVMVLGFVLNMAGLFNVIFMLLQRLP
ncbi:MAG: hypothetical protein HLX51_00745 [Micrococcaceae bacterium]|nr:hypothetical protein [Micrococcaceae bacterium]